MANRYVLVLHGGAGTISPGNIEAEHDYHQGLLAALGAGQAVLAADGSAIDSVVATVKSLEDCPWFNAGYGAVFNAEEKHELDALVMDGATLRAGAVAG